MIIPLDPRDGLGGGGVVMTPVLEKDEEPPFLEGLGRCLGSPIRMF